MTAVLSRHILFVDAVIKQVSDDMINANTHIIRYNTKDSFTILESKVNEFAKDCRPIDSVGFVFHGSRSAFSLASDCTFFTNVGSQSVFLEDDEKLTHMLKNLVERNKLQNVDFLACNLASYDHWKQYFDILGSKLNAVNGPKVVIGASFNATGPTNLGGDWVLEISGRDSKAIYFNDTVLKLDVLFATHYTVTSDTNNVDDITFFDTAQRLQDPTQFVLQSNVMISILDDDGYIPIIIGTTKTPGTFEGANKTVTIKLADTYDSTKIPYKFPGLFQIVTGTVTDLNFMIEANPLFLGTANDQIVLNDYAGWINTPARDTQTNICTITNCASSGNVLGLSAGGIAGYGAGAHGGVCEITLCTSSGHILGLYAGGIVGSDMGSNGGLCAITRCTTTGDIDRQYAGGIVGAYAGARKGTCVITDCTSSGDILGPHSGGIIGYCAGCDEGSCTIINSTSTGNISAFFAGGITGSGAGCDRGSCTIINSTSSGDVLGQNTGGITGSGAGFAGTCAITNCATSGDISDLYAGGVVGAVPGVYGTCEIINCTSSGNISGSYTGGISGSGAGRKTYEIPPSGSDPPVTVIGTCTITNCTSSGAISMRAGGIVGAFAGGVSGSCTITNCTSSGNITGSSAGGITGPGAGYEADGICTITNCTSSGNISGLSAGGIAGQYASYDTGTCTINKCMASGQCGGDPTIGSITGSESGNSSGTLNIDDCYYKVRLIGSTTGSPVTTIIPNHESNDNNMKGTLLYSAYPVLNSEYYNIHAMGIEGTNINYGLQVVKINTTENNMHPIPSTISVPVPENMEIAYGYNTGKVGTILKFTLTQIPASGTIARFCIPNADRMTLPLKDFGVYDINDQQIGSNIVNDITGSNTFNFVFPSGYQGTLTNGVYVFFVRNPTITTVEGGGDPHLITVTREKYLLDNRAEIVNLFTDKKSDISIHGYCGMLANKDFKYQIYCVDGYVAKNTLAHLFSYTYFRKFVIRHGTNMIEINADTLNVTNLTDTKINDVNAMTQTIGYNYIEGDRLFSISNNKYYPKTNNTKMIEIWIDKKTQMIITSDVNTDERHYLKLSLYNYNGTEHLTGGLIKNDTENVIKWTDKKQLTAGQIQQLMNHDRARDLTYARGLIKVVGFASRSRVKVKAKTRNAQKTFLRR